MFTRHLLATIVLLLTASAVWAMKSDNLVPNGDFENFNDHTFVAGSGQPDVVDLRYVKKIDSPYSQAEVNAGMPANEVRAWQFHPEYDMGRWFGEWERGHLGVYDGSGCLTTFDVPRDLWDPTLNNGYGDYIEQVYDQNISLDPLDPTETNHVLEGVSFRTRVGVILPAPTGHVAGNASIDFRYYWNNWTDLPPGSPGTDAASIFHVVISGFNQADLPGWEDRWGPNEVGPGSAAPLWWSPNWSEWGWAGIGDDEPEIHSLGNQWNDFSDDHPDRVFFEADQAYDYYYMSIWQTTFSEPHLYWWFYGDRPSDRFAIGIDDIELNVTTENIAGDFDDSGLVNLLDINPFVLAITNAAQYASDYPFAHLLTIDPNGDGIINLLDIPDFVTIVTGGGGEVTELPEPATVGLIAMGALALLRRRGA